MSAPRTFATSCGTSMSDTRTTCYAECIKCGAVLGAVRYYGDANQGPLCYDCVTPRDTMTAGQLLDAITVLRLAPRLCDADLGHPCMLGKCSDFCVAFAAFRKRYGWL